MEDEFIGKYSESPQFLKNPLIAEIVLNSLKFNHQKKYILICALVMSNHAHCIIKPLKKSEKKYYSISEIMLRHKTYTALQANKILKRNGIFWQREYFDHYIRDLDSLNKSIKYILNNPIKAGLVSNYRDWKHYWLNDEYNCF